MWKVLKIFGSDSGFKCDFSVDDINDHFVNVVRMDDSDSVDFSNSIFSSGTFSFRSISEDELWSAFCRVKSKSGK